MIGNIVIKILNKLIVVICLIIPLYILKETLNSILFEIEKREKTWITHHTRPKFASAIGTFSDKLKFSAKIAIVIQGPIIKDEDFTLETIKIYKKNFDDTIIILSTWEDENKDYLRKIKKEGIEIILCKKPEYPGISNINFQITTSIEGLRKAKAKDIDYALKTRTDQRMYAPNIKDFLCNVIEQFPVVSGYKQKMRIVGVSLNTFKYRLYGLSDMNTFGQIDDMLLYWGVDLDLRKFTDIEISRASRSIKNFAEWGVCETYFEIEFLKKIGRELKWTLEDSWKAYSEHFCIVDKEILDLYWYKYERRKEYKYLCYDSIRANQELNFREWLNLHHNLNNKRKIPEDVLDINFPDVVQNNSHKIAFMQQETYIKNRCSK